MWNTLGDPVPWHICRHRALFYFGNTLLYWTVHHGHWQALHWAAPKVKHSVLWRTCLPSSVCRISVLTCQSWKILLAYLQFFGCLRIMSFLSFFFNFFHKLYKVLFVEGQANLNYGQCSGFVIYMYNGVGMGFTKNVAFLFIHLNCALGARMNTLFQQSYHAVQV